MPLPEALAWSPFACPQEFLAEVLAKLPTFQPSYLANLLAAMARASMRAAPPPEWTAVVAAHVAPRMYTFSGGDLTQTLWGLAMLKVSLPHACMRACTRSYCTAVHACTHARTHSFS